MKKLSKIFCFGILPALALMSFVIIGEISKQQIYTREGNHHTMSGAISFLAWSYRGVLIALLIIAFSFVLFSKTSSIGKILVFLLILIFNIPIMYFMNLAVFFPAGLLIIPILNIFAFIPALIRKHPQSDL